MKIFRLSLEYNESYAFREYPKLTDYQRVHQELVPDFTGEATCHRRCTACGALLNKWDDVPPLLAVKKKSYDVGITYDGVLVVSERFMIAYESAKLSGLVFDKLPNDHRHFMVRAQRAVPFDSDRRKTRFINKCLVCGTFESVVGASPVYLRTGTDVGATEFVRTDLEFGTRDEQHPLLICGALAAQTLSASSLKGFTTVAIKE
jgi:hypothetical protein